MASCIRAPACNPRFCNQLDLGLDCMAASTLVELNLALLCVGTRRSNVRGGLAHCPASTRTPLPPADGSQEACANHADAKTTATNALLQ